jgi:hypothetical protein
VATDLPGTIDVEMLERLLAEVGQSFLNYRVVATRESEQRKELSVLPGTVASVPYFTHDIADLAGLLDMGAGIWR